MAADNRCECCGHDAPHTDGALQRVMVGDCIGCATCDGMTDAVGQVLAAAAGNYAAQRTHELQPLADALTIHVRGITDVRIENTGGNVYCVVGRLGAWYVYANEEGWSITDEDASSIAWGGWGVAGTDDAYRVLPMDEDTEALYEGECDAAALALSSAISSLAVSLALRPR